MTVSGEIAWPPMENFKWPLRRDLAFVLLQHNRSHQFTSSRMKAFV